MRVLNCLSRILLVAVLGSTPAAAQRAEANLLFDEGRALMSKRDYAQAASKLEQSQQLDPAVGTLLNLGECYLALGRTTSAWTAYRDAAALAATTKQSDRERYATRKAQELEARLSRLEVAITPEARVPGLSITRNGVPVPEGLWGAAIPVDPGVQRIEAKAPGSQSWTADVQVGDATAKARVEIPALIPASEPAPSGPPAAPAEPTPNLAVGSSLALPPPQPTPAPVKDDHAEPSLQPLVGWITTGAGAAAGVAGIAVYFVAQGKINDANCPGSVCVRGTGNKSLHDDGRGLEKLGGGLMILGAAAMTTGVVLVLSAPEEPRNHALRLELGVKAAGLDVRGSW